LVTFPSVAPPPQVSFSNTSDIRYVSDYTPVEEKNTTVFNQKNTGGNSENALDTLDWIDSPKNFSTSPLTPSSSSQVNPNKPANNTFSKPNKPFLSSSSPNSQFASPTPPDSGPPQLKNIGLVKEETSSPLPSITNILSTQELDKDGDEPASFPHGESAKAFATAAIKNNSSLLKRISDETSLQLQETSLKPNAQMEKLFHLFLVNNLPSFISFPSYTEETLSFLSFYGVDYLFDFSFSPLLNDELIFYPSIYRPPNTNKSIEFDANETGIINDKKIQNVEDVGHNVSNISSYPTNNLPAASVLTTASLLTFFEHSLTSPVLTVDIIQYGSNSTVSTYSADDDKDFNYPPLGQLFPMALPTDAPSSLDVVHDESDKLSFDMKSFKRDTFLSLIRLFQSQTASSKTTKQINKHKIKELVWKMLKSKLKEMFDVVLRKKKLLRNHPGLDLLIQGNNHPSFAPVDVIHFSQHDFIREMPEFFPMINYFQRLYGNDAAWYLKIFELAEELVGILKMWKDLIIREEEHKKRHVEHQKRKEQRREQDHEKDVDKLIQDDDVHEVQDVNSAHEVDNFIDGIKTLIDEKVGIIVSMINATSPSGNIEDDH
jgi:hypothetical protein